jgi:hypothetical protein
MMERVERDRAWRQPAAPPMTRLLRRLAEENRVLLGLLRCGWTLEEAEVALRRGRAVAAPPRG